MRTCKGDFECRIDRELEKRNHYYQICFFMDQFGAHIFFAVPITPPFIFGAIEKEYGDLPDIRFSKLLHIDNVFIGS